MNTFIVTLKYFLTIMGELAVLFIGISALIAFGLMYLPQDKLKNWLSSKGAWANIMAVLFGAVTPFCACSTVPITYGLIQTGVSFGTIMSFVIASPLMDPLVFILLGTFLGWKVAIIFFLLTSVFSVLAGIVLEKIGWSDQVRKIGGKGSVNSYYVEVPQELKQKIKLSFKKAWGDFKGIFWYMVIGVGIGAAIYGYLPEDLLARVAGPDNPFAILITAIIGLPLYIRVESALPIGLALLGKGVSMGAVITLIISGAGVAIPELTMFAKMFKKKVILAFVIIVFIMAVISGLLINLLV